MKQYPTLIKIIQSILACWKIKCFHHYQTEYIKEWIENCYDGELFIEENFYFGKEELNQQSLHCVARNKCLLKMRDRDTLIEQ